MKLRVELYPKTPYNLASAAPDSVCGQTPDAVDSPVYQDVVVLVDVLRSATIAPLLFDSGLEQLGVAGSISLAKKVAQHQSWLLMGERRGLPAEGFNYGNSPAELRGVTMQGRSAMLVSETASRMLPLTLQARHVLLASLYNADAVAAVALQQAQSHITLICGGFSGNEDLDDTLTAGYISARIKQAYAGSLELQAATLMSMSLLKAFPDPLEALWQSHAGHYLRKLDLQEDLAIASLVSQSHAVPVRQAIESHPQGQWHRFTAQHAS